MSDEQKMRIYVNADVKMSRGKYAAMAVHAALEAVGAHPNVPVVVLGASRDGIAKLATTIHDAGRTELEPGTLASGTDWVTLAAHDAETKAAALEEGAQLIQLQRVLRGRIDEWRSGSDSAERVVLDLADAIRRTATPEGHGADWSDWQPGDDGPSCKCGYNGTPEDCSESRTATPEGEPS